MSVAFVLVPIAIAVAGAIRAQLAEGESAVRVETRMRDENLLEQALTDYGCQNVRVEEKLAASLSGEEIVFERGQQGTFEAKLYGVVDPGAGEAFVHDVEREYTRLLQARVYERVVADAAGRGFTIESERLEDDNSVVLTLRVPDV